MTQTAPPRPEASPTVKFLINMGPLIAFFGGYYFADQLAPLFGWADHPSAQILSATAVLVPSLAVAALAAWLIEGRLPAMHVVGLVLGVGMGGLTLWLQDGAFIKMKPTAVYVLFAVVLSIGLATGRVFLKSLLSDAIPMDDHGWRRLTVRWALFFIFAAVLNEVIWRTQTESLWVNFKVWGMPIVTFVFLLAQTPLMIKHQLPEDGEAPK